MVCSGERSREKGREREQDWVCEYVKKRVIEWLREGGRKGE